jgi:hypothetical protein
VSIAGAKLGKHEDVVPLYFFFEGDLLRAGDLAGDLLRAGDLERRTGLAVDLDAFMTLWYSRGKRADW